MTNRRWFLMDRETFEAARPAFEQLQAQQHPLQALQTLWNAEMSACLVRIDGASKEWRANQSWTSRCQEVYSRDTHPGPEVLATLAPTSKAAHVKADRLADLLVAFDET